MILRLASLDDTARLGRLLAEAALEALAALAPRAGFAVLLQGELGCGKTTLAAAFVKALPGGAQAEVSSPSFTLCNVYPTQPPVFHVDLYRAGPSPLPDEAAEALDGCLDGCLDGSLGCGAGRGGALLVVEWPEYLLPQDRPADSLSLAFSVGAGPASDGAFDKPGNACDKARMLKLEAHGPCAARVLAGLAGRLSPQMRMHAAADLPGGTLP